MSCDYSHGQAAKAVEQAGVPETQTMAVGAMPAPSGGQAAASRHNNPLDVAVIKSERLPKRMMGDEPVSLELECGHTIVRHIPGKAPPRVVCSKCLDELK